MKGQDRDTAWMEHILKLLGALRSGSDSLSEQERQTAKEIARFIDEMPGGFLIYRAEGSEEIIHANRALLRLFCCDSMEEFRAHTKNSFRGLVFHEDLESVERTIWRQVTESQYDLDYVEYRIVTKNGDTRWIEDYGHYLHSPSTGGVFYVFLATPRRSAAASGRSRTTCSGRRRRNFGASSPATTRSAPPSTRSTCADCGSSRG